MPWYLKIGLKLFLARLPISYGIFKRLGVFVHGKMDSFGYSQKIFNRTLDQVGRSPKSILELGPGDSVNTAILGAFHDLETIYLVDAGDFASKDMAMYQRNIDVLKKKNNRSIFPLNHLIL